MEVVAESQRLQLTGLTTYAQSIALDQVQSPLIFAFVVNEESWIHHEFSILECLVHLSLFQQLPSLYRLGEIE